MSRHRFDFLDEFFDAPTDTLRAFLRILRKSDNSSESPEAPESKFVAYDSVCPVNSIGNYRHVFRFSEISPGNWEGHCLLCGVTTQVHGHPVHLHIHQNMHFVDNRVPCCDSEDGFHNWGICSEIHPGIWERQCLYCEGVARAASPFELPQNRVIIRYDERGCPVYAYPEDVES